jgi:hypothetical protein
MGTSLNGLTPAGTYPGLIKTGDNAPIDSTLKTLSDGNGNNLPMAVSTTAVNFTNQLQQSGVAVPTASQVAAKQDTLVSGTNIKTINGTSVLGSGDIVTPYTPPSGVSGAIQFSNGSAFASDASNLFWDDTNDRLGIGTNAPTQAIHTTGNGRFGNTIIRSDALLCGTGSGSAFTIFGDQTTLFRPTMTFYPVGNNINVQGSFGVNIGGATTLPSAQAHIKGSGSTSATTSLLVQNSAGTAAMTVSDNLNISIGGGISSQSGSSWIINGTIYNNNNDINAFGGNISVAARAKIGGGGYAVASAVLELVSTTAGFLPPRMTTTQKNAIASPAAGLVVYDSTTNKLCCYNGSTWNDLF